MFVQHQPFQFHISLEAMSQRTQKDSGEGRESHSKIEADDEFGVAMQRNDS